MEELIWQDEFDWRGCGHLVLTARSRGWDKLQNGFLLRASEVAGFDVMLTGDQWMRAQQNNAVRKIALVVLTRIDFPGLEAHIEEVRQAVERAVPGSHESVTLRPRYSRPHR